MQSHELSKDAVLWWENDVAESVGIVEKGRIGVRTGQGLIGVALSKMVIGESSILTLDGPPATRQATLFALEDGTVVTEYPASQVKDAFGVGVPRLVLRSLFGHICSNSLLVIGANLNHPVLETGLIGLIQGMGACEREIRGIKDWDAFMKAFRMLYELRNATDRMRQTLVPSENLKTETIEAASKSAKELFKSSDLVEFLEHFIHAEEERRQVQE